MQEEVAFLLTPSQLAEMLGVKEHTLAVWRMKGKGPAFVKTGKSRSATIRYRLLAVEAWLEENEKVR